MLKERRRPHPIEWGVLVLVLFSCLTQVYIYGKLSQKVEDLANDMQNVKGILFDHRGKN